MKPGPYSRCSRSPRMTFVLRVFTFCTTAVTKGHFFVSSRQNALELGNASSLVTSVTSTSPLSWPTRTTTWRMKPVPRFSS